MNIKACLLLLLGCLALAGCAEGLAEFQANANKLEKDLYGDTWNTTQGPIKQNAYGLGVHQDQYGRPVKLQTRDGHSDPLMRIQKPDAYGPGVHMDQFGRPVRAVPRW